MQRMLHVATYIFGRRQRHSRGNNGEGSEVQIPRERAAYVPSFTNRASREYFWPRVGIAMRDTLLSAKRGTWDIDPIAAARRR
jgi:hypothetical protein